MATREEVVDAEIVRTFDEHAEIVGAHHEAFKFHRDKAAEEAILTGRALLAAKNDLGHGKWIEFMPAVGMSRQYAHRFMQIGENLNVHNCGHLPKAVATLYELSRLAPEDVEHGIETGRITPDMTIREAREYAQPEPPANVNPATGEIHDTPIPDEERVRQAEATYERLRNEGVIPPPPTDDELRQSVYDLIGNKPREPHHLTPEDKFAKALNAVGAAIRINHGVNEALLDDDGWAVLQALGLR